MAQNILAPSGGALPIKLFISYSHRDEALKDELKKHLSILKRQAIITEWHDRRIPPGDNWSRAIDTYLESAKIVLLLVSPDFLASDYCYDIEMKRALERHERGESRVIPIFLRPCDWEGAPFGQLQGLPVDAEPVTSSRWPSQDEAFRAVARGIRAAARACSGSATEHEKVPTEVEIKLIADHRDQDVVSALEIYDERIPPTERFESPDIIRWLREDQEQRAQGETGPRDYFIVAKRDQVVCGFTLIHFYPRVGLSFIAYLVAERGTSLENTMVSQRLFDFVDTMFTNQPHLKQSNGFLSEVDDPALAPDEEERKRRLARIRLFYMLAERNGMSLRALDFDYLQPHVVIPSESEIGKEIPMLLMHATRIKRQHGWIEKQEAEGLLDFICNWLYPEGFSNIPEEIVAYRTYLKEHYCKLLFRLPERVPILNFAQVRSRDKRNR